LRCEPPVAILPSLLREGVRQSKSLAMNLQNFFGELRQRHVYRVAITYAIVAWLLIQIATQVFPFFEIPNWVVRLVVLVIVLGFPLALILAWAFEITPQGIKRAENIAPTFIGDLTSEKRKEAWAAAASDAEKAVAIDSNLAEAHAALGWVRFFTEWNFAEGLAQLRRANQLSPWNSTANDLLARVVVYLGQFEEAEELARQAIELDPLAYQPRTSLARVLSAEGKLDEAEAAGRKGVELQPTAAGCRRWQVFVAIQRSNGAAARSSTGT
jgi:tetratricopeptide (TPR) repeat protein